MLSEKDQLANSVVSHMMKNDLFSQWLGIEVLSVREGYSQIKMTVREEMVLGSCMGELRSLWRIVHLHLRVITAMIYQWLWIPRSISQNRSG
jgi:hypothetical protein